jgi:orotidine-5'-phosphate decarboxylase
MTATAAPPKAARNFRELRDARIAQGFHVCVGLDLDYEKIPVEERFANIEETLVAYARKIVEATHDSVACYKPNMAFYEGVVGLATKMGRPEWIAQGLFALRRIIQMIHELAPTVPVILDFKRGDIADSNNGPLEMALALGADAITVHGYLGEIASVDRFTAVEGLGVIVLCRTSSPGSVEFQNLYVSHPDGDDLDEMPLLYEYVAERVADWQTRAKASLGIVLGATALGELTKVCLNVGDELLKLVPGVGKQGGTAFDVAQCFGQLRLKNFVINNSSGVTFAKRQEGETAGDAARRVVLQMNVDIKKGYAAGLETAV